MKNKQSVELTRFYQSWLTWAEAPHDRHPINFNRSSGLCGSLSLWCFYALEDSYHIRDEMLRQFLEAGMDAMYPFNGHEVYNFQASMGTMHECPKRLAWVRDRIAEVV